MPGKFARIVQVVAPFPSVLPHPPEVTPDEEPVLVFTAVIVVITIGGSIWVMFHLNTNMMPMPGGGHIGPVR